MTEPNSELLANRKENPVYWEYRNTFEGAVRASKREARKTEIPTMYGMPSPYLAAIHHFTGEPESPEGYSEILGDQVGDALDIRFSLESAMNYLGARYLSRTSTIEENLALADLQRATDSDDPGEAVSEGKYKVRHLFGQDELESLLPDTNAEKDKPRHLSARGAASLAQMILDEDASKPEDEYSLAHDICSKIVQLAVRDIDPYASAQILQDPAVRSAAIEVLFNNLPADGETRSDDFMNQNDPLVQQLIASFELRRDLITELYLKDLDTGRPRIFKKGELVARVDAMIGDSPERDFMINHAESIEDRMRTSLTRITVPDTGDYKDAVYEYLESEKALAKAEKLDADSIRQKLSTPVDPAEPAGHNIQPFVPLKIEGYGQPIGQKPTTLEIQRPNIREVIRTAIEKAGILDPKLMFESDELEKFNIPPWGSKKFIDKRYVRPTHSKGHHYFFSARQVITMLALQTVGNDFRPALVKDLDKLVKEMYGDWLSEQEAKEDPSIK